MAGGIDRHEDGVAEIAERAGHGDALVGAGGHVVGLPAGVAVVGAASLPRTVSRNGVGAGSTASLKGSVVMMRLSSSPGHDAAASGSS